MPTPAMTSVVSAMESLPSSFFGPTMQYTFQDSRLVLIPQTEEEIHVMSEWKASHTDHAFVASPSSGTALVLTGLGPCEEACREPINISGLITDPALRLIGNFAPTPFTL